MAFYGVFIDRIVGLLGLLLLNLIAISINPVFLQNNPAVHYAIIAMALFGFAGVFVLTLMGNLKWLTSNRVTKLIHDLSHRIRTVYRSGRTIGIQTALSVIIHLLSMMTVYLIGTAIGLDYGLLIYLVVVPPVILLTIIPISLAKVSDVAMAMDTMNKNPASPMEISSSSPDVKTITNGIAPFARTFLTPLSLHARAVSVYFCLMDSVHALLAQPGQLLGKTFKAPPLSQSGLELLRHLVSVILVQCLICAGSGDRLIDRLNLSGHSRELQTFLSKLLLQLLNPLLIKDTRRR